MDVSKWIDSVLVLSTSGCFVLFIKLYFERKTLLELYFAATLFFLFLPYFFHLFDWNVVENFFEWGKLLAITTYISGLLVLIRESKPVFARFPVYLTALPFVSILFFPLIIESLVIKDLINAIYQGGAVVVTILVFSINQLNQRGKRFFIAGIALIVAAYCTYWFYFNRANSDFVWISEMLLASGIIAASTGFTIRNNPSFKPARE